MWNYELEVCNLLSTNLEMSSSLTIVKRLFKQTNTEIVLVQYFFADPHKVIFFCFVQLVLRCFVELVLLRFRASAPLKTTWGGWCRCSCPYHSFVNLLPNSFAPALLPHHKRAEYLQCTQTAVSSKKWYSAKHWLSFYIFLSNHCPRKKNFFWSSTMLKQWLLTFCYWPPIGKQANISPK